MKIFKAKNIATLEVVHHGVKTREEFGPFMKKGPELYCIGLQQNENQPNSVIRYGISEERGGVLGTIRRNIGTDAASHHFSSTGCIPHGCFQL